MGAVGDDGVPHLRSIWTPAVGVDDNVPNVPPGFGNVTPMVATGSTSTSVGRNKVKVSGYRYIVGGFSVQF